MGSSRKLTAWNLGEAEIQGRGMSDVFAELLR